MAKHVIFQNYDMNEYLEIAEEAYREDFYDGDESVDIPRDDLWDRAYEEEGDIWDCEKWNLNFNLPGEIVQVTEIERWCGWSRGIKRLNSTNLNSILQYDSDCEYGEWYVKGNEIHSRQSHHDGTNLSIYRKFMTGIPESDYDDWIGKYLYGTVSLDDFTDPIGGYVRDIHGWHDDDEEDNVPPMFVPEGMRGLIPQNAVII